MAPTAPMRQQTKTGKCPGENAHFLSASSASARPRARQPLTLSAIFTMTPRQSTLPPRRGPVLIPLGPEAGVRGWQVVGVSGIPLYRRKIVVIGRRLPGVVQQSHRPVEHADGDEVVRDRPPGTSVGLLIFFAPLANRAQVMKRRVYEAHRVNRRTKQQRDTNIRAR